MIGVLEISHSFIRVILMFIIDKAQCYGCGGSESINVLTVIRVETGSGERPSEFAYCRKCRQCTSNCTDTHCCFIHSREEDELRKPGLTAVEVYDLVTDEAKSLCMHEKVAFTPPESRINL